MLSKRGRIEADIDVGTAVVDDAVTGNITAASAWCSKAARGLTVKYLPALYRCGWGPFSMVIATGNSGLQAKLSREMPTSITIGFQLEEPELSEQLAFLRVNPLKNLRSFSLVLDPGRTQ